MLSELDKILQSCYSRGFVGTQVYATHTGLTHRNRSLWPTVPGLAGWRLLTTRGDVSTLPVRTPEFKSYGGVGRARGDGPCCTKSVL